LLAGGAPTATTDFDLSKKRERRESLLGLLTMTDKWIRNERTQLSNSKEYRDAINLHVNCRKVIIKMGS
jgi:hypothetical protein